VGAVGVGDFAGGEHPITARQREREQDRRGDPLPGVGDVTRRLSGGTVSGHLDSSGATATVPSRLSTMGGWPLLTA
jgi:hypothetical protein